MIPLPSKYKKWGYTFEKIKREGDVAIYSQSISGKVVAYEVFIVQKKKAIKVEDHIIQAREAAPPASKWGELGHTCKTLERAETRFEELKVRKKELDLKRKRKKSHI